VNVESWAGDLGVYGGTLLVCFVSGLVPFINAEVWLVAIALSVAAPATLACVVVLAAIGQMIAKVLLYLAAKGALELPTGRYRAAVDRARARIAGWKKKPLLLLAVSSSVGLPPFYVVALLAGALEIRLPAFCVLGLLGRIVRFGAVVVIARTGWHLF
jgi:membrane protein YqaA with SNARE-associated domain